MNSIRFLSYILVYISTNYHMLRPIASAHFCILFSASIPGDRWRTTTEARDMLHQRQHSEQRRPMLMSETSCDASANLGCGAQPIGTPSSGDGHGKHGSAPCLLERGLASSTSVHRRSQKHDVLAEGGVPDN